jgi:Ser/Thr protein kinase RdoA (MazF antagonist)
MTTATENSAAQGGTVLPETPEDLARLERIGAGATAAVYRLGDGSALKLFKSEFGEDAARYEASIAEAVGGLGIGAPSFSGTVMAAGRIGIVEEFVPGPLLLDEILAAKPKKAFALARKLARTHAAIHEAKCDALPRQRDRLSWLASEAKGIDPFRERILAWLARRDGERAVCHGDLHVGNVIVSGEDFRVIDWMNAYSGEREGDVLRSYLSIVTPFTPFPLSPAKRIAFALYKRALAEAYLREYSEVSGLKARALKTWWPAIAAARIADNVPGEKRWLLGKIKRNLRRLSKG